MSRPNHLLHPARRAMRLSALDNFSIGFWHPFGPHAGETAEEIIARKRNEIDANGWTF